MKHILITLLLLFTSSLIAAAQVVTIQQDKIRPSYPFPAFLSTGPYIWYEGAKNQPIKGHTFRIATFTDDQMYKIFIEKVEFGDNGCCLEIVNYRELLLSETFMKKTFPNNRGHHGFKLIRWIKPESFEFQAYSGRYILSNIGHQQPSIEEIKSR